MEEFLDEQYDPVLERTFRGHKDTVQSLSFNPNMKQLASGAADAGVMMWNFKPSLRAFRFVGHQVRVLCSLWGDTLTRAPLQWCMHGTILCLPSFPSSKEFPLLDTGSFVSAAVEWSCRLVCIPSPW